MGNGLLNFLTQMTAFLTGPTGIALITVAVLSFVALAVMKMVPWRYPIEALLGGAFLFTVSYAVQMLAA